MQFLDKIINRCLKSFEKDDLLNKFGYYSNDDVLKIIVEIRNMIFEQELYSDALYNDIVEEDEEYSETSIKYVEGMIDAQTRVQESIDGLARSLVRNAKHDPNFLTIIKRRSMYRTKLLKLMMKHIDL